MDANILHSPQEIEALLIEGAEKLNFSLDTSQIKQLYSYLTLLSRWNKVYNLTAIRDLKEMVTHHLLDSLAVAETLKDAKKILDVGSGAGLPGMVLAIVYPDKEVSLVDSVQKKTAFLSQVKTELHLRNLTVYTGRVEKLYLAKKFDAIISRAFSDLNKFVAVSDYLLEDTGYFYAMKGTIPEEEIELLPETLKVKAIKSLDVPFLDAERHLLIIEKSV